MKKLTMCALFVLSANSYSYVEHFNEQQWTTGEGATGAIQILEEKITPITEEEKKNFNYNLTARTQGYYGRAGNNITMQGEHGIQISNYTNQRNTYTVNVYLCALNISCFNNTYSVAVNSGYSYTSRASSLLNSSFKNAGNYTLQAGTRISGAENALAYDNKPINVTF